MKQAAQAALQYSDTLPNDEFAIPESSPIAKGTGRRLPQAGIKQFPGDGRYKGNGHETEEKAQESEQISGSLSPVLRGEG
jgi:hypothetical protein